MSLFGDDGNGDRNDKAYRDGRILASMAGFQARREAGLVPRERTKTKRRPTTGADGQATEATIQRAILSALERHPMVARVWRQSVGALQTPDGRRVSVGTPGQPDIMGFLHGGRFLAVEVKRHDGRISPEQAKWLARATEAGAAAGVARSVEEAVAIAEGRRESSAP